MLKFIFKYAHRKKGCQETQRIVAIVNSSYDVMTYFYLILCAFLFFKFSKINIIGIIRKKVMINSEFATYYVPYTRPGIERRGNVEDYPFPQTI